MNKICESIIDNEYQLIKEFSFKFKKIIINSSKKRIYFEFEFNNDNEGEVYHISIGHIKVNGLGYKENVTKFELEEFESYELNVIIDSPLPHNISFNNLNEISMEINVTELDKMIHKKITTYFSEYIVYDSFKCEDLLQSEEFHDDKYIYLIENIEKEFEKIKNHKPKAIKKLKLIGELISSAYRLNPQVASNMWTYIYNLNKNDGEKSVEFYTKYIFNKLSEYLNPKEYSELLMLNEEIFDAMRSRDYFKGRIYSIIEGLISKKRIDALTRCLEISSLYKTEMPDIYQQLVYSDYIMSKTNDYESYYQKLIHSSLEQKYVDFIRILYSTHSDKMDEKKFSEAINLAIDKNNANLFVEILYKFKDKILKEDIQSFFRKYVKINNIFIFPTLPRFTCIELQQAAEKDYDKHIQFITQVIYNDDELINSYLSHDRSFLILSSDIPSIFVELVLLCLKNKQYELLKKNSILFYKTLESQSNNMYEFVAIFNQIIDVITGEIVIHESEYRHIMVSQHLIDERVSYSLYSSIGSVYTHILDFMYNDFETQDKEVLLKSILEVVSEIRPEISERYGLNERISKIENVFR